MDENVRYFFAVAGPLIGVWLGWFLESRREARATSERRREEIARVLAPVEALMIAAHPERLTLFNVQQQADDVYPDLLSRWETLKVQLLTISYAHPSEAVRDLARRVSVSFGNSLIVTGHLMKGLIDNTGEKRAHDEAMREYRNAKQVFEKLIAEI